ncbi:hypothetical protein AB4Z27_05885 [Cupriavidus sp. KB_39]|jgi:hypothetical protein|uniref:hypothetical protein n=1 Tax=Cupriavidus sp. KB_39 TaxID=3233036 RepID=UPI003F928346
MSDNKNGNGHSPWKAVWAFAGHALAGACIFVILAFLAFGLGKFVGFLEANGASYVLVVCLTALEYLIFAADALCVLFFLWNAVQAAFKEMK